MKLIEMCGGVGTKLWPASRRERPKQYLPLLLEGKSLFEDNLEFLRQTYSDSQVIIQTNSKQLPLVLEQAPGFPKQQIIVESEMRNHGPAMALLAFKLQEMGCEKEPFMLMQADVLRQPKEKVVEFVKKVNEMVLQTGKLITGGFRPQSLVLGVDYLIARSMVGNNGVYKMEKWLGRENSRQIFDYRSQGRDVFLHANHYAWTAEKVLKAFAKYKPEWADKDLIINNYDKVSPGPVEDVFAKILGDEGYVVELPFSWRDFGTWSSVADYAKENPEMGLIDEAGNLIYPIESFKRHEIGDRRDHALIRVDGMPDLIIPLERADKVGEIVNKLKEEGRIDLL